MDYLVSVKSTIADNAINEVLSGTVDFLINRDCGNWDSLSADEQEQIRQKATIIAGQLVDKAIYNINCTNIRKCVDNGSLATAIVDLLPDPEFSLNIRVVVDGKVISGEEKTIGSEGFELMLMAKRLEQLAERSSKKNWILDLARNIYSTAKSFN